MDSLRARVEALKKLWESGRPLAGPDFKRAVALCEELLAAWEDADDAAHAAEEHIAALEAKGEKP